MQLFYLLSLFYCVLRPIFSSLCIYAKLQCFSCLEFNANKNEFVENTQHKHHITIRKKANKLLSLFNMSASDGHDICDGGLKMDKALVIS